VKGLVSGLGLSFNCKGNGLQGFKGVGLGLSFSFNKVRVRDKG